MNHFSSKSMSNQIRLETPPTDCFDWPVSDSRANERSLILNPDWLLTCMQIAETVVRSRKCFLPLETSIELSKS